MSPSVKYIEVDQLHGISDVRHEFVPGVNVLYGRNGAGKTTLLHILANALPGHYQQFVYLQFARIEIGLGDGTTIRITRESTSDAATVTVHAGGSLVAKWEGSRSRSPDYPRREGAIRVRPPRRMSDASHVTCGVSYFPAFRAMLDAWPSADRAGSSRVYAGERSATSFARDLFGRFVPEVSYPSLSEIDRRLGHQLFAAFRQSSVVETRSITQAAITVYKGTLNQLPPEMRTEAELTAGIKLLCEQLGEVSDLLGRRTETDLSALKEVATARNTTTPLAADALAVLGVYHNALSELAEQQKQIVAPLRAYLDAVNRFLADGRVRLVVSGQGVPQPVVRHASGKEVPLSTLSSGGRQVVAMMYAAARLSDAPVVLIDEPELSLHVDWQRPLLQEIAGLTGDKQVIVTTHSPEVSAEFDLDSPRVQKFRPAESNRSLGPDPFLAAGDEVTLTRMGDESA